jgi:hypothetical protein
MAINDHPDLRCGSTRHRPGQRPPAVAVVIDALALAPWRCGDCLNAYDTDPDPVPHDVVYLDPTRQRRPVALELNTAGVGTVHYHARGAVCTDDCYTVPAVAPDPMTTEATP